MKLKYEEISLREIAELQRAMVPPHSVFPFTICYNCGHPLSAHYEFRHGITRVACSNGTCNCPGINIQGKLIDEFEVGDTARSREA